MAERLKAHAWKACGSNSPECSNHSLSAIIRERLMSEKQGILPREKRCLPGEHLFDEYKDGRYTCTQCGHQIDESDAIEGQPE